MSYTGPPVGPFAGVHCEVENVVAFAFAAAAEVVSETCRLVPLLLPGVVVRPI